MSRVFTTGLGAFLMYLMDPDTGHRRRIRLRQKSTSTMHRALDFVDIAVRDLQNRTVGLFAHARYLLKRDVDDTTLQQRVAATLGRHVSHPRAIKATVENGEVLLVGPILGREIPGLLASIERVPGVRNVINHLEPHDTADVPSLQGGRELALRTDGLAQNWPPSLRLLGTAAGSYLFLRGTRRGNIVTRPILKAVGALLVTRSTTNSPLRQTFGLGGGRRNITFQKFATIAVPLENAFEFFSNFTNYPHFMRNVREVRELGERRYHWTVAGPAGTNVSWNATVTRFEPNQLIAWRSDHDSLVGNAGMMRFEKISDTETGVRIDMTYNPPAGVIGHAVASFFGADPKKEMDEDMARAKSYLETGKPARDASARERASREMERQMEEEERSAAS